MQKSAHSRGLVHRWLWQQDNDRKHQGYQNQDPQRPNPTENLWRALKMNVHAWKLCSLDQLERSAREEWAK